MENKENREEEGLTMEDRACEVTTAAVVTEGRSTAAEGKIAAARKRAPLEVAPRSETLSGCMRLLRSFLFLPSANVQ
jgi:hypothetical protein